MPKLIKETPAPVLEEKADVRKEPPIPEAPVVKVVSENPAEVKDPMPKVAAVEDAKKIKPDAMPPSEKKEEIVINSDAIKKEDDEIKEVQKQDILKKKEDLIEKLEENEQKQQQLLEEQKKILHDIKIEKEKLVEEGKELEKFEKEIQPKKNLKENKLQNENKIIVEGKEEQLVNNPENLKNVVSVQEPKIIKQIKPMSDTSNNENQKNLITDDQVKIDMANGVPLPIAIQHMAVDGVKSAKLVETPENGNEGKLDGKVLRREILGDNRVKEQREKRDIEEVVDSNLEKDLLKKEDIVYEAKVDPLKVVQKTEIVNQLQNKNVNDVLKHDEMKSILKVDLAVNENIESLAKIKASEENNEVLQKKEETENDQCVDKTKLGNVKFADELKPEDAVLPKIVKELPEAQVANKGTLSENKIANVLKKGEITTLESIIKTPAYLSNPSLVLPVGNIQSENNVLNNEAKPMKRDLKSIQLQHENKKDNET